MEIKTIKDDKPVVLIPIAEYKSMKETTELFFNHPASLKKLREENNKVENGECISFEKFLEIYK